MLVIIDVNVYGPRARGRHAAKKDYQATASRGIIMPSGRLELYGSWCGMLWWPLALARNETSWLRVCLVQPEFHLARHVTSRHDTTRSTSLSNSTVTTRSSRRARHVERVGRVASRRDVTSQVEFGLNGIVRIRLSYVESG